MKTMKTSFRQMLEAVPADILREIEQFDEVYIHKGKNVKA